MTHTAEVGPVLRERHERLDAAMSDKENCIPALVRWTDQESAALTYELEFPAGFEEVRERVLHIEIVCCRTRYWLIGFKFGRRRVVSPLAETVLHSSP